MPPVMQSLEYFLKVGQDLANRQVDASAKEAFLTVMQMHISNIKQALDQPGAAADQTEAPAG